MERNLSLVFEYFMSSGSWYLLYIDIDERWIVSVYFNAIVSHLILHTSFQSMNSSKLPWL